MKNKRADIPITILVLGVVAICGLAILSFIVSSKVNVKSDDLGLEVFEKLHADVEKFEFYKNVAPNEAATMIGLKNSPVGGVLTIKDKKYSNKMIDIVKYEYKPK